MFAKEWLDDHVGAANDAAKARLAAASSALSDSLQNAQRALADRGTASLDYARAVGGSLRDGSYRFGQSTRNLIAERPLESALVIGAAAFAVGWLWKISRDSPKRARPRAPSRARAASKNKT